MRSFRCLMCSLVAETETSTGPLPSICDGCDPDRAARREHNRSRNAAKARARTAELVLLRDLHHGTTSFPDGVDRQTIARAVRDLGHARGPEQTRKALLYLRDAAHAWAQQIPAPHLHQEAA